MHSDHLISLLRDWDVELDPMQQSYGEWNEILFAHRAGQPCVVKVCGDGHSADDEALALAAWDGAGAVRLLASAPGVLLLERLDPDRTLATVPMTEAVGIFSGLLQRLSIPAPDRLPRLSEAARAMAEDHLDPEIVPEPWLPVVRQLAAELAREPDNVLVHGDLHSNNILAGIREPWLAIDPKPTAGCAERSFAEFLWTRLDEVDDVPATLGRLAAAADLDSERARAWTIVRTTSYLIWAVEHGLTEDPVRCRRLIAALV